MSMKSWCASRRWKDGWKCGGVQSAETVRVPLSGVSGGGCAFGARHGVCGVR
ncbi:hypothetical protein M885DRAFT_545008 [Pelagophyceae sp. CCMP2097]|nr:hypothetical protein M885DRAFT_545008 [Pelagophyceae sp. CCMP2097]